MVTCPNGHTNPAHARFCEECGVPIMFGVVACLHGHINPEHAHFCEECGVPIMSAVVACPHGHLNPDNAHFCEECGVPLPALAAVSGSSRRRPWYTRKWRVALIGVSALLLAAGGAVAVGAATGRLGTSSAPTTSADTAIKNWWSGAQQDFTDLKNASDAAAHDLDSGDDPGLAKACQRMHDTAVDKLQALMPTPDPELTAEVRGMIDDFNTAAHLCLAGEAGSPQPDRGQFLSNLDQANKQMKAAQEIMGKSLAPA